jgi:hypothetical protein
MISLFGRHEKTPGESNHRSRKDDVKRLKFIDWHQRQLFGSFAWLISCLMCGFLFVAVVEYVAEYADGIFTIISLVILYFIGLAAIEMFRRFWLRFAFAQYCASSATCSHCNSYGLFEVRADAWPIYARCQMCDHRWIIGDETE